MKTALTELNDLSEQDLHQIDEWLDEFSYRKTARLASQKFNRPIHRRTIERFANRAGPKDFLDDSSDAEQILQFAASGQTQFTEAAIHVLEQTAFKLTFNCTHRAEDMQALKQVTTMLFRHRNAAVRERTAKIQEQKLELRRQELQGRGILPMKLPVPTPTPNLSSDPAWRARKAAELKERLRNLTSPNPSHVGDEVTSLTSPSTPATVDSTEAFPQNESDELAACISPSPSPENHDQPISKTSAASPIDSTVPSADLQTARAQLLGLLQSKIAKEQKAESETAGSADVSSASSGIVSVPENHPRNSIASSAQPQPQIENQKSQIENALAYTRRRREEFAQWKQDHMRAKPGCPNAYQTQILDCPCGHPLQCPEHPWPAEFFSMNPNHPEYEQALLKNGIPISDS
jgi:hypothetical protein